MKKSRATLKDYFQKGAIPTEASFADLIDSMLNQEDDNISKLPDDPLKIVATGVDEALLNFYRIENNEEKLSWQIEQNPGGKSGLNISDAATSRLFIENGSGNVAIGATTPDAKLQVVGAQDGVSLRVGLDDTNGDDFTVDIAGGQGLVSLVAGAKIASDGKSYTFLGTRGASRINLHDGMIKFHTSDATDGVAGAQAVGLESSAAKMALTNTGNLGLGTTSPKAKLQVVGGAIMPEAGSTETSGLLFPPDPNGGSGDRAWMRYYSRSGEQMTLEIGIANENSDHIALMPSGGVGVGGTAPIAKLDVLQSARSGTHPSAVKGLYVTGSFGADSDGVEFRHSNGTQGIGFGFNTIYATGSVTNQDLGLKARGTGKVIVGSALRVDGGLQVTGALQADGGLQVSGAVKADNGLQVTGDLQVNNGQIQINGDQKIVFSNTDTTNNLKLQLWSGYGLGINPSTLFYAANGNHSWRDQSGINERMLLSTAADGGLAVKGTGTSSFAGNLAVGKTGAASVLHIYAAQANSGLTIQTGDNANNQGIAFQNAGDAYVWHIFRKDAGSNNADLVFSGGPNENDITALPTRVTFAQDGNVDISGSLHVTGSQNIIKTVTFTLAIKNAGANKPASWNIDYSNYKFTEIYTVFAVFQGFSLWDNGGKTDFSSWGSATSSDAIPQHVYVKVASFNTTKASGTSFCSESKSSGSSDNTVLFTVVVMGKV